MNKERSLKLGRPRSLICGVGINDADYNNTSPIKCKTYVCWYGMLKRCYSEKFQLKNPSYIGCSVDERWHSFMNFKAWMEKQDWEGNDLDKDLLFEGNKIYGPDTCAFVSRATNIFSTDRSAYQGDCPLGVTFDKSRGLYKASTRAHGKSINIGRYETPEEAHQAWYNRKRELAIELAAEQSDPRVAAALLARFP